MRHVFGEGMGELCRECKYAHFDENGWYCNNCNIDHGVVWDEEEECEDCAGYEKAIIWTKEDIAEIRAEEEIAYMRDNGGI